MSNSLVPYGNPAQRAPDVETLPWLERKPARKEGARFDYGNGVSHDRALLAVQQQSEVQWLQQDSAFQRALSNIENTYELDRANAANLSGVFRNGERLMGLAAEIIETAAGDFETRCHRTPSAAPFLADLLAGSANAMGQGVRGYIITRAVR